MVVCGRDGVRLGQAVVWVMWGEGSVWVVAVVGLGRAMFSAVILAVFMGLVGIKMRKYVKIVLALLFGGVWVGVCCQWGRNADCRFLWGIGYRFWFGLWIYWGSPLRCFGGC